MGSRYVVIRLCFARNCSRRPIMDEPPITRPEQSRKIIPTKVGFIRSKGPSIPINNRQTTLSNNPSRISTIKIELLKDCSFPRYEESYKRDVIDRF